jgi:hypothetical protein
MASGQTPDELEGLVALRDRGILTDEELKTQKKRLAPNSRSSLRRAASRGRRSRWRLGWVVIVVVVAVAIVIGVPQIRHQIPGINGWFGGNTTTLRGFVLAGQYAASSKGKACSTDNLGYATTVSVQDNTGVRVATAGLSEGSVQSAGGGASSSAPDACLFTFLATVPTNSSTLTITVGGVPSLTFPEQVFRKHHWSVVINLGTS